MPWSHDIPIVLSDIKFHGKDAIENTSASYPVLPTAQNLFKMCSRCSYIRLLTSSLFDRRVGANKHGRPEDDRAMIQGRSRRHEAVGACIHKKKTKQRSGGYCVRSDPKHDSDVLRERSGHQCVAESE